MEYFIWEELHMKTARFPNRVYLYDHRHEISERYSKILLWLMEGQGPAYMARQLGVGESEIFKYFEEITFMVSGYVGAKRTLGIIWKNFINQVKLELRIRGL